ncbi:MAG: hypothetical protein KIT13_12965 [Burkholderiales bacterium]|nr:hypothetical protein [Burkholderiales bacterium]
MPAAFTKRPAVIPVRIAPLDPGLRRGDGRSKAGITMANPCKNRMHVIPAKAGIQYGPVQNPWTPASAGVTAK